MRSTLAGLFIPALSCWVLLAALDSAALGQGSGSSRVAPPAARQRAPTYRQPYAPPARAQPSVPRPPTTEEFARSLWTFLVRPQSPYTQWPPLPGKEGLREVSSPHGPSARLYANPVAAADPKNLPPGSVLVLEDYAAAQKTRTGINILYRVKGYDPKNGDWYWMKYLENGTLVRTPPGAGGVPVAGRVMACIGCHHVARGNDFVFSNDPAAPAAEVPDEKMPEEKKGGETIEPKKNGGGTHARPEHSEILLGRNWPVRERVSIDVVDHRSWDSLVKRYVDVKGRVDYGAWKETPGAVQALEGYLDVLARADAKLPAARPARLAYWINTYNALTVWVILQTYTTPGVQDHAAPGPGDNIGRDVQLRVGGASFSLGQIEDQILRKLHEPRIHFAIVCGARGCPRLLNEGYNAAELEGQLTRNARAFFADETKFTFDPSRNQVQLSAILDWYAADFGKNTADRLRTIAPYLPEKSARRIAEGSRVNISYKDYDWNLNSRPTRPTGPTAPGSAVDGGG